MVFSAGTLNTAQLFNALLNNNSGVTSVSTQETSSSTSYTDLATVGPTVTLTSAGNRALLLWTTTQFSNSATISGQHCSVAITGATTIAASDSISLRTTHDNQGAGFRVAQFAFLTINPGSNTYTMKYRCVSAVTSVWATRSLFVFAP